MIDRDYYLAKEEALRRLSEPHGDHERTPPWSA